VDVVCWVWVSPLLNAGGELIVAKRGFDRAEAPLPMSFTPMIIAHRTLVGFPDTIRPLNFRDQGQ